MEGGPARGGTEGGAARGGVAAGGRPRDKGDARRGENSRKRAEGTGDRGRTANTDICKEKEGENEIQNKGRGLRGEMRPKGHYQNKIVDPNEIRNRMVEEYEWRDRVGTKRGEDE